MSTPIIDRLQVSRGPALVTFRGGYFLSKDDIVVDLTKSTKALPSSAYGPLTKINQGIAATLKMTPVGEFEHLDVLWSRFASLLPGQSLLGNADYPLLIQPLDTTQRQVTFHAAGISQPPDLNFTANDTLIGAVDFFMVGKNNTPVNAANRLFQYADNALTDVPYDPEKLLVQAYSNRWLSSGTFVLTYGANTTAALAWDSAAADLSTALNALASIAAVGGVTVSGSVDDGWTVTFTANGVRTAIGGAVTAMPGGTTVRQDIVQAGAAGARQIVLLRLFPWANFAAREGMKVSFKVESDDDKSDAIGTYDKIFRSLEITATGIPQGMNEEAMLAATLLQGPGSEIGRKLSTAAHDLVVIGDGVYFSMSATNVEKTGLNYGCKNQRVPALQWGASRSVASGGTINPLFTIGTIDDDGSVVDENGDPITDENGDPITV